MRALLASAVGVACAGTAVLALPPALSAGATPPPSATAYPAAAAAVPGSTRTLPLTAPAAANRALTPGAPALAARAVQPFSMLGVTWDDPAADLHGSVQVRTRSAGTGTWSPWRTLEPEDDLPDLDSPDRAAGRTRGGTAPLWVGDSDGVEARVIPAAAARRAAAAPLPGGLRLEMVDPGSAAALAPSGRHRRRQHRRPAGPRPHRLLGANGHRGHGHGHGPKRPVPRPRIILRAGWGADEGLRESDPPSYGRRVKAVFLHHTDSANDYDCSDAPAIVRSIYRYHVKSEGWRDIGYNFLVDKCGRIYEGRAGGVNRPVIGAHTLGFNTDTTGVAVIGEFTRHAPSRAAVRAVERLAAWKLALSGIDPRSTTTLLSRGSGKYRKGAHVRFHVIAGHRDGFVTDCPGDRFYAELGEIRRAAAVLQRTGHFDDHGSGTHSGDSGDQSAQGDNPPSDDQSGEDPWDDADTSASDSGDLGDLMQEVMG